MDIIDWIVLLGTLIAIVAYGTWKTRQQADMSSYLKGDNQMKWWTIGLSIMATQASAITFLSTPGQAYENGMGFVQFYFGLPLAVIVISAVIIPIYYKLNVYTAYEYLENRFDIRVRLLTAFLFLISRGLAAGITIYAPAIVLSTLLEWNLTFTNLLVGVLVIIYTVSGGTRAVSITQKWQMAVIFIGMFIAFFLILSYLPENLAFGDAIDIAGYMGKMEIVDTTLDLNNRYTIWTGILGGFFLSLSYFGTDQSQVQRYLGGKSISESRLGLLFNGILKVPMQFFILFVGVMVFVFYQFNEPPAFFNQPGINRAKETKYAGDLNRLEEQYSVHFNEKKAALENYISATNEDTKNNWLATAKDQSDQGEAVRDEILSLIKTTSIDIFKIPRKNYFMGKWIKHSGWYPNYRQPQLFRSEKMSYDSMPVHEGYISHSDKKIGVLKNNIWQFPFKNTEEVIYKANRYSTLGVSKLQDRGINGSVLKGFIHGSWSFIKHYIFKLGFLDGSAGFVIAFGNFEGTFYRYVKLSEVQADWKPPKSNIIQKN